MGIATSSVARNEGVTSRAIRYFTTDAVAAADTTFNFGFVPAHVRFINLTDRIEDEWFAGMASPAALHTIAAGTRTLVGAGGLSVTALSNEAGTAVAGDILVPAALMVASKSFAIIAEMA